MQDFLLWLDKKLSALPNGVNGTVHSVSQCLGTGKDLEIIAPLRKTAIHKYPEQMALDSDNNIQCWLCILEYLIRLVAKEMDLIKVFLYVLQAICLVPPLWEYIKTDLAPNRVS